MPNYKISDIEGISPSFATKLHKANVRSVGTLLKRGAKRNGRNELSQTTGIDNTLLLKWVNMADLYRIKGIGSEYSELLEKAGVDTVKELRNRTPENLYAKIVEVNSKHTLVRVLPGLNKVKAWIKKAKKLEPMITY